MASTYQAFIQARAAELRANDRPPANRAAWAERAAALRKQMLAAAGTMPAEPAPLQPRTLGTITRPGYRIEKLVFQTLPDAWMTASLYLPDAAGKKPAMLCVHGHWRGARRDPTVQARCAGLARLGFVVLCVDAFGSGERYTNPAPGTYHGALYGSTLWPAGLTLLGVQLYENRRAVDYLLTRPDVDGERLGITGASGGGNQTMYAGALDERFAAVVPVCSVGNYQAYLKVACCVCEVLPTALSFTEEGDVLSLVAPRSLMVINATQDGVQFSPEEAAKSVASARALYALYGEPDRLKHAIFESKHDYSKPMREAMYGWMKRWLMNAGDGSPVPEPELTLETPEDLACFPNPDDRPKGFLFPPSLAGRTARTVLARPGRKQLPAHPEEWEATALVLRRELRTVLGTMPKPPRPRADRGDTAKQGDAVIATMTLESERDLPLTVQLASKPGANGPTAILLHADGAEAALKQPLADELLAAGWTLAVPQLRATGAEAGDVVAGAIGHNPTEYGLWLGRPLLGQWTFELRVLTDWLTGQPGVTPKRTAVVGFGPMGVLALVAGAMDDRLGVVATIGSPATLVTDAAYPAGMPMGLLAPGLFRAGDVPHLAALIAPRKVVIVEPRSADGLRLAAQGTRETLAFTRGIFEITQAGGQLHVLEEPAPGSVLRTLGA